VPVSRIDHLVVTAGSLAEGADYVRRALGAELQPGGEHALMGTHNCLLRLGERVYLEVIAANPAAAAPGRPRWFQLDRPDAVRTPRLATWVARTDDIHAAAARSPVPLGTIEPMSRGGLEWLITVRRDGGLLMDGVAPTVIQWPEGVHPADSMKDSGCSLTALEAFHPEPEALRELLASIGFEGRFPISPQSRGAKPYLVATIETASGARRIGGP
jgi:glyoxalase-like protein